MARRCIITGKEVQTGNNVSHSKRRTRRRFLPNMQQVTFRGPVLGTIQLRVSTSAVRTIEHKGGIEAFLMGTPNAKLSMEALTLKRRLVRMTAQATAA